MLTGRVSLTGLSDNDARRALPRFADGNFEANLALVRTVEDVAAARGATPGQVALAWLAAQGTDVVPIPGTKRRRHLGGRSPDGLVAAGNRAADMTWVNRDTPPQSSG